MSTAPKKNPEKIVADTNILVSMYIFPGMSVMLLINLFKKGSAVMGISDEILSEFIGVCIRKFGYEPYEAVRRAEAIKNISTVVYPKQRIQILKDEPDNRVLECAVEFGAGCVITGDKKFLELKKFRGIEIMSPADYLRKNG